MNTSLKTYKIRYFNFTENLNGGTVVVNQNITIIVRVINNKGEQVGSPVSLTNMSNKWELDRFKEHLIANINHETIPQDWLRDPNKSWHIIKLDNGNPRKLEEKQDGDEHDKIYEFEQNVIIILQEAGSPPRT
jgi:hypothetical protein